MSGYRRVFMPDYELDAFKEWLRVGTEQLAMPDYGLPDGALAVGQILRAFDQWIARAAMDRISDPANPQRWRYFRMPSKQQLGEWLAALGYQKRIGRDQRSGLTCYALALREEI